MKWCFGDTILASCDMSVYRRKDGGSNWSRTLEILFLCNHHMMQWWHSSAEMIISYIICRGRPIILQLPLWGSNPGPVLGNITFQGGHKAKNLLPHLHRQRWWLKELVCHISKTNNARAIVHWIHPPSDSVLSAFWDTDPCGLVPGLISPNWWQSSNRARDEGGACNALKDKGSTRYD